MDGDKYHKLLPLLNNAGLCRGATREIFRLVDADYKRSPSTNVVSSALSVITLSSADNECRLRTLKALCVLMCPDDLLKVTQEVTKQQWPLSYTGMYDFRMRQFDCHFFKIVEKLLVSDVAVFGSVYGEYVNDYKRSFGDYWPYAVEENAQLILATAKRLSCKEKVDIIISETGDFIGITKHIDATCEFFDNIELAPDELKLYVCKCYRLNEYTLILLYFQDKLRTFVNQLVNDGHYVRSIRFEKLFKNTPQIRRLFFGRIAHSKSLFEEIAHTAGRKDRLVYFNVLWSYIYTQFKLQDNPRLLTMVNFVLYNIRIKLNIIFFSEIQCHIGGSIILRTPTTHIN